MADTPQDLNVRRRLVQRFGVEIVIAVFHCKRRPGYWRDRLDKIRAK